MNTFERELTSIVGASSKTLCSLVELYVTYDCIAIVCAIPPTKVTRFKCFLSDGLTATVNADKLDALQD
jgi:hypothetical protein